MYIYIHYIHYIHYIYIHYIHYIYIYIDAIIQTFSKTWDLGGFFHSAPGRSTRDLAAPSVRSTAGLFLLSRAKYRGNIDYKDET